MSSLPEMRPDVTNNPFPMTTRVLAAVIQRDDFYLICRRPSHKRHGDLWEFPGGKVEPGETDLEAARRELDEELGVRVTAVGAVAYSVADPGSEFVIEFLAVEIEGEPECHEHSEITWVARHEVVTYALAPSDQRFAESMLDR